MSHQLSPSAMFDDMCREIRKVLDTFVSEDILISCLAELENYRKEQGIMTSRISSLEDQVEKQDKTIQSLNLRLKNVRLSLQKETELKRRAQKERDQYKNKVSIIAKMLNEDSRNGASDEIKRQIFSSVIQVRNLKIVEEAEDTETSMSGTEWEKSEDDLDGVTVKDFNVCESSPRITDNDLDIGSAKDLRVDEIEESFLNVTTFQPLNEKVATDFGKKPVSTASLTPSLSSKRSSISSCYSRTSQKSIMDVKKHDYVSKKVMNMRERCNCCNGGVAFLTQCYKCRSCHATVHPSCRNNLPLPCLPSVIPSKTVRFVTIGKLCPKVRPRVPAVLVYCTQELEGRKDQLYVHDISETESKNLRDKLMAHKKGAPDLKTYTTRQLCGVVKSFFRQLDEPLITTTLWREFNRVAATKDKIDRINLLEETLDQLPPPNRETLAFLMKHLQHVLEMERVGCYHLKRTFAPFVVGNSQRNLTSVEIEREKEIQTILMTCFLDEYTEYCNGGWDKVLNYESCKEAMNDMTCIGDCFDDTSSNVVTMVESTRRRRSSIMGGTAETGTFTPLKLRPKPSFRAIF